MIIQNNSLKVLIVHPEKQHSLKTVASLQSLGVDCHFITSFYFDSLNFSFFNKLLPKKLSNKLNRHGNNKINKSMIHTICTFPYLFISIIRYFDTNKLVIDKIYPIFIKFFNKKVYDHVKVDSYNLIIAYDTLSGNLLKEMHNLVKRPKLVVDMSAASYLFMQNTYINNFLGLEKQIAKDISLTFDKLRYENSILELKYADFFITASNFSKNSIVQNYNINANCVEVIPYGIEQNNSKCIESKFTINKNSLNILFVGNVTFEKGIYTLIEAVSSFDLDEINVTVVGEYLKNNFNTSSAPINFNFVGWQPKSKLTDFYSRSDLLVLPSLCDGFGFVVMEALSHGLPVICSDNVGSSELIKEDIHGLIFETGNSIELEKLIRDLYLKNVKLNVTASSFSKQIEHYTWHTYAKKLKRFLTYVNNL